ncbi:hypothetical protein H4R24_000464 [Coemansia sp. RSA 988]|nr:hypothetical protein H4R24_000464 [Coemansia sp. RSA 988]
MIRPLSLLILIALAILPHTLLAVKFDKQAVQSFRRNQFGANGYGDYWQDVLHNTNNPIPTGFTKYPEHPQALIVVVTETVIAYVYVAPPGEDNNSENLPPKPTDTSGSSDSDSDSDSSTSCSTSDTSDTNEDVDPTDDDNSADHTDQTDGPNHTTDAHPTSDIDSSDKPDEPTKSDKPNSPKPTDSGNQSDNWKDMLDEVNNIRAEVGRAPLKLDDRLNSMAQAHSDYQKSISKMTHDDPAGSLGKRCTDYGVKWSGVAENVAWNYKDVSAAVKGWRKSDGHYKNMIGDFTIVGFGVNNLYWTQVFAKERQ